MTMPVRPQDPPSQALSPDDAPKMQEASDALTDAVRNLTHETLHGTPLSRASARDAFQIALAEYSACIDTTLT
jgi:hypothetical protein